MASPANGVGAAASKPPPAGTFRYRVDDERGSYKSSGRGEMSIRRDGAVRTQAMRIDLDDPVVVTERLRTEGDVVLLDATTWRSDPYEWTCDWVPDRVVVRVDGAGEWTSEARCTFENPSGRTTYDLRETTRLTGTEPVEVSGARFDVFNLSVERTMTSSGGENGTSEAKSDIAVTRDGLMVRSHTTSQGTMANARPFLAQTRDMAMVSFE